MLFNYHHLIQFILQNHQNCHYRNQTFFLQIQTNRFFFFQNFVPKKQINFQFHQTSVSNYFSLYFLFLLLQMPPKKVQQSVEPKVEEPKIEQKKGAEKGQKNLKESGKKDGKGSIDLKNNKSIEKLNTKQNEKKQQKKDEKGTQDKKESKNVQKNDNKKDSKGGDKKDAKNGNQVKDNKTQDKNDKIEKKDANNKSISKLEKLKDEDKNKKQTKELSSNKDAKLKETEKSKIATSKNKDRVESKANINKMEEQKIQKPRGEDYLIKQTGLLEAYEVFLRSICKYGLPTGDIYQFAAQQIEKFERKKKAKELKLKAEMQIRKAASKKINKEEDD